MDQKPVETVATPLTVASTVDAQGNVVVWDNGPQEPVAGPGGSVSEADKARYDADLAAWKASGGLPQSSIMAAGDATHALTADPMRYSLEPLGVDDAAVATKIKEIRDRREAAKKAAQDRADAVQLAADRKEAISAVMAEHAAAAEAKKVDELAARRTAHPPKFGSQLTEADRIARAKAEADRIARAKAEADREKADHPASGTPHPKG